MMYVIAVANQKGGVAKTTSAVNLAAALSTRGRKTLLVDLDPQANATQSLPVPEDVAAGTFDVLAHGSSLIESAYALSPTLSLLPSHIKLARLEPQLQGAVDAYKLKEALDSLPFEFVIIDCPPSLGALTTNALVASTHVLVPVTASYYGINAVNDFMETFYQVKRVINPQLVLLGILVTIYDSRVTIARDVVELLKETYTDQLLTTVISKNIRLDEAASAQTDIFSYDSRSKGAEDYTQLTEEVLSRVSA